MVFANDDFKLELTSDSTFFISGYDKSNYTIPMPVYSSYGSYKESGDTLILSSFQKNFSFTLSHVKYRPTDVLGLRVEGQELQGGYEKSIGLVINVDTLDFNYELRGFNLEKVDLKQDSNKVMLIHKSYNCDFDDNIQYVSEIELTNSELVLKYPYSVSKLHIEMTDYRMFYKSAQELRFLDGEWKCKKLNRDSLSSLEETFFYKYTHTIK